mgnify:CR=1 FL=1
MNESPRPFKVPQSVLVVIHTPALEVLLIERADVPGFWQSVTGAKDHPDEPWAVTAAREVLEAVEAVAGGRKHLGGPVAQLAVEGLTQAEDNNPLAALSVRERQVIQLVVQGHTSAAIGEQLHLSPKTVESYRSRLMAKLGVSDLPALVRLAIREGLISADDL